jgi:hypothetical protein
VLVGVGCVIAVRLLAPPPRLTPRHALAKGLSPRPCGVPRFSPMDASAWTSVNLMALPPYKTLAYPWVDRFGQVAVSQKSASEISVSIIALGPFVSHVDEKDIRPNTGVSPVSTSAVRLRYGYRRPPFAYVLPT